MNVKKQLMIALLFLSVSGFSDSYGPAEPFDVFSENNEYVAHITPYQVFELGENKVFRRLETPRKAHATISQIKNKKRMKLWEVDLTGKSFRGYGYLSNDGEALVTIDNTTICFYKKDIGFLRKYDIMENVFPRFREDKLYHNIDMTASSILWDKYGVMFFYNEKKLIIFCVWVDWYGKWVAWNTRTGGLIQPTKNQVKTWDEKARKWSLNEFKKNDEDGEYRSATCFLASLKTPQDKKVLESYLSKNNFSTCRLLSSAKTTYIFYSLELDVVDRALARWENLTEEGYHRIKEYNYLGTLMGTIKLPKPALKTDGVVVVSLKSINDGEDIKYSAVIQMDSWVSKGEKIQNFNFEWKGLLPGKYKLIVNWNLKQLDKKNKDSMLSFISEEQDVIIKKGSTFNNITIKDFKLN